MPLSKQRNRDRMREARLHVQPKIGIDASEWLASRNAVQPSTPEPVSVQPKVRVLVNGRWEWVEKPDLDAEGNVLY